MVLTIVLAVLGAWLLVSVVLAFAIGRGIKLADRNHKRAVGYRPAAQPVRARMAS